MAERPGFYGFRRSDGRVGTRNHVLVVPTVICSSLVAERVAAAAPPLGVALPHLAGCGQLGPDMRVTHETLAAYCGHPNVGAVVVLALGCEQVVAQTLADAARRHGKPVDIVAIQSEGGTIRATAKGSAIAQAFGRTLEGQEREWCDISELVLSLKCGGSDYTSGLASNPALGRVTDRLVDLGGSAVLGEIAEIMGAEHLLAARATRKETATQLIQIITRVESEARALGLDIRGTQPSPGNIRGGLTTIEEKSLGATHKGGERAHLEDVVGYAAPIRRKGLTVMDTPGLDVESVTGMVGGGAQVVVFTTGLGTPTGNPIAPVIKITGNARTARQMADNLDLEVSGIMSDTESLDAAADRLFDEVLAVASGKETAAERLGHREFAIHRRNPTI
ncbi:MAG TPA: UxaA family hydrolase [Vicinamibacterales bacterium]|jgi:altronate dehydratase large subunit|nr:UxaA family hydrolase [Vicinamibacterales bacterium]